jgi:tight adherence protein C
VVGIAVLLFAGAAVLVVAGALELRQARPQPEGACDAGRSDRGPVPAAALSLGLPDRIRRAGRSEQLTAKSLLFAKAMTAATGLCLGSILGPLLPDRIGLVVLVGMACFGFLLPDLLLERAARRRHRRMVAALPDALDLLAVSASAGRSLGAGLVEIGESGRGPLAGELAETGADLAWGMPQGRALESLRRRIGGPEIAGLCATLERSRRLGSPLADQLRRQSSGLRQDQRRAIEEAAARAAPKIQLVIALVLVPSVLLLIVAALLANSDALLGIGYAAIVTAAG